MRNANDISWKKKNNTIRYPNVLNMVISWQLAYVGFFNFLHFFFPMSMNYLVAREKKVFLFFVFKVQIFAVKGR